MFKVVYNYLMELKEQKKQDALDLFGGSDEEEGDEEDGETSGRYARRQKLIRFAVGRGFTMDEILSLLS